MLKRNLSSMAMSLVEVIIGILLLVNPIGFTSGIIIAFGIVLMIMGIGTTIRYFRTEPEEAAVGQIFAKGLLMFLAGAFCAFNSHWFIATFPVLTLVYGVVILIMGITKIQWTMDIIRMKRSKWFWAAISAAISIVCGVVIITSPFSTTAVLWMFIGISLIVEAVFDMIGSIFGNRKKKADETESYDS
ncbi:MAG: DUF308 domain-containing protein [Oscillospiraceae bacterium]|nr:DUF308 domain-containing protein [Oscillospiraceae bacterium]